MADPQDHKQDPQAPASGASAAPGAGAGADEARSQRAAAASTKVPDEEAAKHLLALLSGMGDAGLTEVTLPPPSQNKKKKKNTSKTSQEKFTRPAAAQPESATQKKEEKSNTKPESNAPLLEQWRRSEAEADHANAPEGQVETALESPEAEREESRRASMETKLEQDARSRTEIHEAQETKAERKEEAEQQAGDEIGIFPQMANQKSPPELAEEIETSRGLTKAGKILGPDACMAERLLEAGLELPEGFSLELLQDLELPMPPQDADADITLGEFIFSMGLSGRDLCAYFQAVFYKSSDKKIQQECLDGLLEEASSDDNDDALEVLQELLAAKAACELAEAEASSNAAAGDRALSQLALLERSSTIAERMISTRRDSDELRHRAEEQICNAESLWHKSMESFISRDLERLHPEQRLNRRKNIIKKMTAAAEQLLKFRSERRLTRKTMQLKVLKVLLGLKSCDSPATAKELVGELRKLTSEQNGFAAEELRHIESFLSSQAMALKTLEADLLSAAGKDFAALERLKEGVRDPLCQINELRIDLILNKLSPESNSQDLRELILTLEHERRQGNLLAQEKLEMLRSAEAARRISEAIAARSLNNIASIKSTAETIKREMDRLTSLSKAANPFSRSALLGISISQMDHEDQEAWLNCQRNREIVPDLSLLSASELSILAEHAAHALRETFSLRDDLTPLTLADTVALSQALAHAFESGDRNVRQSIEALFNVLLNGNNKNVLIDGLIQTEKMQTDSSPVLSEYLLKAAREGLSDSQLKKLSELARHDAEGGLKALAGIVRGEAGEEQARLASQSLIDSAKESRYRDQIIRALTTEYEKKSGSGLLLSTLAEISSLDSPCDQLVLELIWKAFNLAITNKDKVRAAEIAGALLRLAPDWGHRETESYLRFLEMSDGANSPDDLAVSLPGHCRAYFIKRQQEIILYGKPEKQLEALRQVLAFADYADDKVFEDILAIGSRSEADSLSEMSDEMNSEFKAMAEIFAAKLKERASERQDIEESSHTKTRVSYDQVPLFRQYFPELNQKTLGDYKRRLSAILDSWHEDMGNKNLRLLQVEHELLDSERDYENKKKEIINDPLLRNQILEKLQSSESWAGKTSLEQKHIIEKRLEETVSELERKADSPINKSKQESLRLAKEHDLLLEQISAFLEKRVLELQSLMDYLYEQYDWPKLNLDTLEDSADAAGYEFGTATLYLPTERLLAAGPQHDFAQSLLVGIMHAMQDASLAGYAMHKAGGDQAGARQTYNNLCGRESTAELLSDSSQYRRSSKSWGGLFERRLLQLAKALKSRPAGQLQKSEELYLQAKFIEGRLHCLSRNKRGKSLELLLEQIYTNDELRAKLYPYGLPAALESARNKSLLSITEKSTFHAHEFQDKIILSLSAILLEVRQYHQDLNLSPDDAISQETGCSEDLLSSPPRAEEKSLAVTPFEALKELNKAASLEGDSLHSKSAGWEILREIYERRLREGFITPAQLKILIGLEAGLRQKLEELLLKEEIKAQTLACLLKLPEDKLRKLFALAPSVREGSVFPLSAEGKLNESILSEMLSMEPQQSRLIFRFLHRSMADPHCSISKTHIERLIAMPLKSGLEFHNLIFEADDDAALSMQEAAAALLVPDRLINESIVSDCLSIARSLSRKLITVEQVAAFADMEEDARCGLAVLLANDALNKESCHSLMQKIQKGEISAANVKELGVARLLSKLPEGFVERVLKQDPSIRNTLFEKLQTESLKKKDNAPGLPELVKRLEPLNELHKAGVISEPLLRMLATPHACDPIIMRLLNEQLQKEAGDRIGPESIFQLAVLSRTNKLDLISLESYRRLIESSVLDRQRLRRQLAEKPSFRTAAETLMLYMPPGFSAILREGNFEKISRIVAQLPDPLKTVFPELFDEDGILGFASTEDFKKVLSLKRDLPQLNRKFRRWMFEEAFAEIEREFIPSTPEHLKAKIEYRELEINLVKLLEEHELQTAMQFIQAQNTKKDSKTSSQGEAILAADPIIVVNDGLKFRLRDSEEICDNGLWRKAEAHEKQMIEAIQETRTGLCLSYKIARSIMDEWARRQLSAGITADTEKALKAEKQAEQEEYANDPYVKMRELLEFAGLKTLRSIQADLFAGIPEGYSNLEFPNGMRAQIKLEQESFAKLEAAFNLYMHKLRAASRLDKDELEKSMAELVDIFDRRFSNIILECGVKLKVSNQSYLKLLYDIELEKNYLVPGGPSDAQSIDLNLQQGLRRLLCEHPNGKQIYRELAGIRYSGITPKYDPSPPSGRPALINPADQRPLTREQRSAFASAIFNDTTAALRGTFRLSPGGNSALASVDMSVLKLESGNAARAAFSRAEEWTHLMYALNNYKALTPGGLAVAELYDKGKLGFLKSKREFLVLKNDFMQVLKELEIAPAPFLYEAGFSYRQEIETILEKYLPEMIAKQEAEAQAAALPAEIQKDKFKLFNFSAGQKVSYNSEPYTVISYDQETAQVFIKYEGESRDPAPVMARYVSDAELAANYRTVQAANNIHYRSINTRYKTIYVLSTDKSGQKVLHNDWRLRCVLAEDLIASEFSQISPDDSTILPAQFCRLLHSFFKQSKERALKVAEKLVRLGPRQELIGSGDDADIQLDRNPELVASRHLQVLCSNKQIALQDLNPKLPTFYNWRALDPYETVILQIGDRVAIGDIDGPELSLIYKARESKYLSCTVGEKKLKPGQTISLGRLHSADVLVSDPGLSKIQATIRMEHSGRVYIKDGGTQGPSNNGIMINHHVLIPGQEQELKPGDRVFTRTGIRLPIVCKKTERIKEDDGRMQREANGQRGDIGVNARHGSYLLFLKKSAGAIAQNFSEKRNKADYKLLSLRKNEESGGPAISFMSEEARLASNQFALESELSQRIPDGWCISSAGAVFAEDGSFQAQSRCATCVDRRKDTVLRKVIADARRRFEFLPPDKRARALTEHCREIFTPAALSPEELDQWYDQFAFDRENQIVLLGDFIKEGRGISSQQAVLLKVLADEFPDMQCKLMRGMNSSHCWTIFNIDGQEIIHDPRVLFFSPRQGSPGALREARYWSKDKEPEQIFVPDIRPGDLVSFDGSSRWRVLSFDSKDPQGELAICADGNISLHSAEIAFNNPEKLLVIGESYDVNRGKDSQSSESWTLQSINKDGSLQFVRSAAIRIRVPFHRVHLRAQLGVGTETLNEQRRSS